MIEKKINNIDSNIKKLHMQDNTIESHKLFGLWIYLMSDCIMFAVLFAVYTTISSNISTSIVYDKIFNLSSVFLETFVLLLSSLSCGLVTLLLNTQNLKKILLYLTTTFILGFSFLVMEIHEFYELSENHFGPDQHAFFSIFFALVGTHGIHIFFGLILILSIFYQIFKLGLTRTICTRILCLSIFWHFLDIIWICIFTFVYLSGAV